MRLTSLTAGFLSLSLSLALAKGAAAQAGAPPAARYPPAPGQTAAPQYPYAAPPGAAPGYGYPGPSRPLVLPYNPGGFPPPGYHLDESPRKALVVTGALTFGVPYLISLMIGGSSRNEADRWLMIPVVGPVGSLSYGMRGCDEATDASRCAGNMLIIIGLAFDLAAQTAGAVLFTMGFVFPKKQWVMDEYARRSAPPFTWAVAPRFDEAGRVGLTLSGTIF